MQFASRRCATVREIGRALELLDQAYVGLYHWLDLVSGPPNTATAVPERHRLCLAAIETVAPAQLEIVGAAEPLQRLGAFLGQPGSAGCRSAADIELLQQDIGIAQARGLERATLDGALRRWVIAPLAALNDYDSSDHTLGLYLASEPAESGEARPLPH